MLAGTGGAVHTCTGVTVGSDEPPTDGSSVRTGPPPSNPTEPWLVTSVPGNGVLIVTLNWMLTVLPAFKVPRQIAIVPTPHAGLITGAAVVTAFAGVIDLSDDGLA